MRPTTSERENQTEQEPSFDLMKIPAEFEGTDEDIVMAATQFKTSIQTNKVAIMKKPTPASTATNPFNNCTFGNIGSINVHIHKN